MEFSRQEYWIALLFPFPVDHILSERSPMTPLSWVALHGIAYCFIELDKAVVHVIRLVDNDSYPVHCPSILKLASRNPRANI